MSYEQHYEDDERQREYEEQLQHEQYEQDVQAQRRQLAEQECDNIQSEIEILEDKIYDLRHRQNRIMREF